MSKLYKYLKENVKNYQNFPSLVTYTSGTYKIWTNHIL